eukprot:TRINITY_DN16106_c0_g1_i1.p1 TRINITY_DN16106_c0_g1~~TRINITY_DN16106_c0_g1_i1.p1  ORF type:complete len:104 (-),score=19.02 TRINITY_DN16106_c0_g1_i1:373-684(-)
MELSQTAKGQTPLFQIAHRSDKIWWRTARILVKHSADINLEDDNNTSPLDNMEREMKEEVLVVLQETRGTLKGLIWNTELVTSFPEDLINMLIDFVLSKEFKL